MGVYQEGAVCVTVPAANVAALAAAIRQEIEPGYRRDWAEQSDAEIVGTLLVMSEGFEEPESDIDWTEDENGIRIYQSIYGKVSFDNDKIEALYAEHGATGEIEAICEGENYRVRFANGRTYSSAGVTIYPYDLDDPAGRAFDAVLRHINNSPEKPATIEEVTSALEAARRKDAP